MTLIINLNGFGVSRSIVEIGFVRSLVSGVIAMLLCASHATAGEPAPDLNGQLASIEQQLKESPKDWVLKVKHAALLGKLKRFSEELAEAKELSKLNATDPDPYRLMEQACNGLNDYRSALDWNSKLLQMGLGSAQTYNRRAGIFCELSRYKDALICADKSFSLATKDDIGHFDRGLALLNRADAMYHISGPSEAILKDLEESNRVRPVPAVERFLSKVRAELSTKARVH